MKKLAAVILASGQAVSLYADLNPLRNIRGEQEVVRASNVEPDGKGGWYVQFTDDELNKEWKNCFLYRNEDGTLTFTPYRYRATSFAERRVALECEVQFLMDKLAA